MRVAIVLSIFILQSAGQVRAQDRDTKVREDRTAFSGSSEWIYNDLEEAIRVARATTKPLLVAFRCIPCEACQQFDDDVARRDPIVRDLLDLFVCVRIPQANTLDLSRFQFDFDQSFAIILMNPDGTIYGRYGTRSERPERDDISLEGLRAALAEALSFHGNYAAVKASLAGKQARPTPYQTPLDYPSIAGRYKPTLDYAGSVARSCVHCHQIRDAERLVHRAAGKPFPVDLLYPYPDPSVLGLSMDPRRKATILRAAAGSAAESAGLRAGDEIVSLEGQPLLSIADLQWVLHNAPKAGTLEADVLRDGGHSTVTIPLREGWRRGDISWRPTTWDPRRMAFGGMRLDDSSEDQRAELGAPKDGMALRVRHVGEYGDHAQAKKAGIEQGDVIVDCDGQGGRMSESDLLAYLLQKKRPGDEVELNVLRFGQKRTFRPTLQ